MAHAINIQTTANSLGQHCVTYSNEIHSKLRQGLEWEQSNSGVPFVQADYIYTGQEVEVADVMQPYQYQFTPNNTEEWDGIDSTLRPIKIDLEFTLDQLEKFYNKWKCEFFDAGKDPMTYTYWRWIVENKTMPKFEEELNLASWAGEFVAPTPGTAGTPLQSVDGFGKRFTDLIAAGRMAPIVTGAFTPTTMVEQVRDFVKQIPHPYRDRQGIIEMSWDNALAYAEDYQEQYPSRKVVEETPDTKYLRVDHLNKVIIGRKAMNGSNRMICRFPNLDSMIIGTREGYNLYPTLRVRALERSVRIVGEFYRFYSLETTKHVFVNDQA